LEFGYIAKNIKWAKLAQRAHQQNIPVDSVALKVTQVGLGSKDPLTPREIISGAIE
jgi:hypothetical protein